MRGTGTRRGEGNGATAGTLSTKTKNEMRAYIITSLILSALAIMICFVRLMNDEYPRIERNSRGDDFACAVLYIGFLFWAILILQ